MIEEWQREIMYRGLATKGRLIADREEFEKIEAQLKIDPHNFHLWSARGIVCGSAEEAIISYSMALSIRPLSANMLYNRGRRYMSLDRYHQSLADLKAATLLDPEDGWKWHFMGVALYFLDRFGEAVDAFWEAIHANERNHVPLIPFDVDWLLNSYGKLGQRDEIEACLELIEPDTPVLDTEETYRRRCLLYRGYMSVEEFLAGIDYEDEIETANQLYGLSSYYRYLQDDLENCVKYLRETLKYKKGHRGWGYKMALLDLPLREKELLQRG